VEQEQKILDLVLSWACTSRPMTVSYLVMSPPLAFFPSL